MAATEGLYFGLLSCTISIWAVLQPAKVCHTHLKANMQIQGGIHQTNLETFMFDFSLPRAPFLFGVFSPSIVGSVGIGFLSTLWFMIDMLNVSLVLCWSYQIFSLHCCWKQ